MYACTHIHAHCLAKHFRSKCVDSVGIYRSVQILVKSLHLSIGVQCAHCLNVEYLYVHVPSTIGQNSRTIIYFVPNFRRNNINYGIRISFTRDRKNNYLHMYLTHRAVYHNDIVLICSEPGIHCTTNINKLLQVRHTAVRPGEVINLLEEGEREREREGKQRGASWVRVVIYYTLGE